MIPTPTDLAALRLRALALRRQQADQEDQQQRAWNAAYLQSPAGNVTGYEALNSPEGPFGLRLAALRASLKGGKVGTQLPRKPTLSQISGTINALMRLRDAADIAGMDKAYTARVDRLISKHLSMLEDSGPAPRSVRDYQGEGHPGVEPNDPESDSDYDDSEGQGTPWWDSAAPTLDALERQLGQLGG